MKLTIPAIHLFAIGLVPHKVKTALGEVVAFAPVADRVIQAQVTDITNYNIQLKPDDVVVEIGTAYGLLPALLHQQGKPFVYIGFEPVVFNYVATLGTMALNDVQGRVFNYAISESRNTLDFVVHPTGLGGASACVLNHKPQDHVLLADVCAVSFKQAIQLAQLTSIDVLVLDCEGAEHEIVQALPKDFVRVVRGELHENTAIRQAGFSNAATLAQLRNKVADCEVACIQMMDI